MSSTKPEHVDFLVLGGGIAGLRAAIGLAAMGRVLVLTKGGVLESSTRYAHGGIAAALGEDDEVRLHLHDTLQAGDGLCREEAVRVLVEEGPTRIQELMDWGLKFDRNGTRLALAPAGAHSRSRVLHAHGGSTGREILRALLARAKSMSTIRVQPHCFAWDLILRAGRVVGIQYSDEQHSAMRAVYAGAVLLATGGLGQAYKETTNPPMASGDGVAMAYRAGAVLSDMEFIQFHPTALFMPGAPRHLLPEALCVEGAKLRNVELERFMPRYHEAGELAPRDVVSRAMVLEMQRTRSEFGYLDLTGLDPAFVKKRFPKTCEVCLECNIDITTDLVPVRPAAHYAIGGVATDLDARTSLEGLFAAGEVAATGVHGANRLASNSLLEGLVFGARAAQAMSASSGRKPTAPPMPLSMQTAPRVASSGAHGAGPAAAPAVDLEKVVGTARCALWGKVGVIRNGKDLKQAVEQLEALSLPSQGCGRAFGEARNILEAARLIARSALAREESRGAHYRSDFPLKDDTRPPRHSYLSREKPVYFE